MRARARSFTSRLRSVRGAHTGVAGALLFLSACTGSIGGLGGEPDDEVTALLDPDDPTGAGVGGGSGRDPEEAGYGGNGETAGLLDLPAPATRAARLTHVQWQNSVEQLLSIEDASVFAADFRSDPFQAGFVFDNDGATLSVDSALWGSYQRAAAEIAAFVTEDPARLSVIMPAGITEDETGARAFIEEFGARAHRRPLSDVEIEDYLTVYRAAPGAYLGLSDFQSGIRLVIEAFVQSPYFIYRIEPSTTQVGNVIPLDGYEVASRLSYMIWNSMPDRELFEAAAAGHLTSAEEAATQAERMLGDPRAERVVASFHEQYLDLERYAQIVPSPTRFPDAPPDLPGLARQENEMFVAAVFERGGGFTDLLTASDTFVNDDLARIYGLTGTFGADFAPASLDASRRKGFLTQIGFLASHATSMDPDPIHRGVFLARRVVCAHLDAPPDNVPPLPPPEGRTNRETIESHTENPDTVCATCHKTIINPLGFPFENYDALGAYRTEDNGHPVDAATEPFLDGAAVPVQNGVELVDALAGSPQAHQCYTRYWLEFAYGRAMVDSDLTLIERLGGESLESASSIKDLIIGLVKTEAFMTRSTEELP